MTNRNKALCYSLLMVLACGAIDAAFWLIVLASN